MPRILPVLLIAFTGIASADDFPDPVNTQAAGEHPPSPREMLELFELPEGFQVKLFAGEPDVQQPIAFDFDDKGRIWVAENYTYSARGKINPDLRDRVIILHDKDGDGEHDERKVFWDKGSMLTGLTWGYGGLWILNDGTLSFIPDKDGDDVPDGEPVVMLNGWTKNAGHNFVNGLLWGPDGWLYGRHGITDTSYPGTPDTPKAERQRINCGIWRFHPTKHTFEVVCHGTTNPWGLDYNEYGDMFMTNNVIGHLWHVIPGAHYERMFGQDFNPHLYELMPQIADHYHWDNTGKWSESRDGVADDLGGGHSHCGGMIYYGQNFPKEYRGKIFMCNTHGRCVNVNRLERKGSTYVGKREPNFLKVNTPWFRGVELKYGPRGCVYLTDWSDNGECHDHDGVHRTSGRIYRISFGAVKTSKNAWRDEGEPATILKTHPDHLSYLVDGLVFGSRYQDSMWHFRRRLRQVNEIAGELNTAFGPDEGFLRLLITDECSEDESIRTCEVLRSLVSIAQDTVEPRVVQRMLASRREVVRGTAVDLISQVPRLKERLAESLVQMCSSEKSAFVRLKLASALQRLPSNGRSGLPVVMINRLVSSIADDADRNVDDTFRKMLWYGLETHWYNYGSTSNLGQLGLLRSFIRRGASHWDSRKKDYWFMLLNFSQAATASRDKLTPEQFARLRANARDTLLGVTDALSAQATADGPARWGSIADGLRRFRDAEIDRCIAELDAVFGNAVGMERLQAVLEDRDGDHARRSVAVAALARGKHHESIGTFLSLLNDRAVYVDICKALAAFDDDPRIPAELLKRWDNLRHGSQEAAMDTLVSRKSYATELAKAIDDGRVESGTLTAAHVRQLVSFNDPNITKIIETRWGVVNQSSEAKQTMIGDLKKRLTPDVLAAADLESGAALFKKSCAACHKLYGEGGKIGPDLTGANRGNMDYLLGNIIDPSAEVPKQFTVSVIALKSGRIVTGVVIGETEQVITVQTDKEQMTIAVSDIDERTRTTKSLMPDGLLDTLSEGQRRDLIAFVKKRAGLPRRSTP